MTKLSSAARAPKALIPGLMKTSARAPVRWHPWQAWGIAPEIILMVVVLSLAGLGWVMVTSASTEIAMADFGDSLHYGKRHGIFLLLGLVAMWLAAKLPLSQLQRYALHLMIGSLVLLALLFLPVLGYKVNGSTRWLNLGVVRLQVSELTKAAVILYLASLLPTLVRRPARDWLRFWPSFLLIGLSALLICLQPDLGAVLVLMSITLGLLFLAGAPSAWFAGLTVCCVTLVGLLVWLEPFRMRRLMSFVDPWADPYSTSYQLTQSLIAIGRGEFLGSGLGAGIQKNFYLPEGHTDFIYAILCEELGLLGGLTVLAAFFVLVIAIVAIGRGAERLSNGFGAYLCYGVGLLVATQVFISVGVNTGLLPTKGLTLPFISYGGTSLLVTLMLMGLVYRVQRENRERLGWSRAYLRSVRGSKVL
jgi:cell division protein FtsW